MYTGLAGWLSRRSGSSVSVCAWKQGTPAKREKIGCSLKVVAQSNGEDLDPTNLKAFEKQNRGPESKQSLVLFSLLVLFSFSLSLER